MMDTSKEYILQCEKAEEMQKLWKPIKGDLFIDNRYINSKGLVLKDFIAIFIWDLMQREDKTWLPRQDQLQEMLSKYMHSRYNLVKAFRNFVMRKKYYNGYSTMNMVGNSMEQLWLAFVMKEKYSKTWNGKDWI